MLNYLIIKSALKFNLNSSAYDIIVTNAKTGKVVQKIEEAKEDKLFDVGTKSVCSYTTGADSKSARAKAVSLVCASSLCIKSNPGECAFRF